MPRAPACLCSERRGPLAVPGPTNRRRNPSFKRSRHDALPSTRPEGPSRLGTVPRHHDVRRGLGLGGRQGREPGHVRRVPRRRRELRRHGQPVHQRHEREAARGVHARPPRERGDGHQVHERHAGHRPERRREPAEEHGPGVRGVAQAAADRLHRFVLAAHLGPDDARRRGDAGVRRPRAAGEGFVRRRERRAGLVGRPGEHDRRPPRVDAVRRAADRVQPGRADGRAGADPDGQGDGADGDGLVAARPKEC